MIDFRYHIVSIVAVFLALGIGLLIGAGVLGDPLLEDIKTRAEQVRDTNAQLRDDITDLNARLDAGHDFALAVEPVLLRGRLHAEQVVFFRIDGTDASLADHLEDAVEVAGGRVVSSFLLLDKLRLADEVAVQELSNAIGMPLDDPPELRTAAAYMLGSRAVAASRPNRPGSAHRLAALLDELADSGFVDTETDEKQPIPSGAQFVVLAGSPEEADYAVEAMTVSLAEGIARGHSAILVAEPSDSTWDIVDAVRARDATNERVATVDNVDTLPGRISAVLALQQAESGDVGHFGLRGSLIMPEVSPRT